MTKNIKNAVKTEDFIWKMLIDHQTGGLRKVVCSGLNNISTQKEHQNIAIFENRIFVIVIS